MAGIICRSPVRGLTLTIAQMLQPNARGSTSARYVTAPLSSSQRMRSALAWAIS
jgi:hypothetical protein